MDWLTPQSGLIAAAVAVPLLVLMYFLRLRRPVTAVSSTLLWRRAVQDLQVNAPFQRLRRNLLLFLQLLAMVCLLVGLAGPVLRLDAGPSARYVLLIDRSASMNATDGLPADGAASRLDQAKRQARRVVESLRSAGAFHLAGTAAGDKAMIIAFDEHAKVVCSFTSDRQKLLEAIDAIEPSDGRTCLAEALTLARAFAQSPGADANNRSSETPARIELFSDGRAADLGSAAAPAAPAALDAGAASLAAGSLAPGELTFHAVGRSDDNVGIVAMQARRSYERPEQVEVFAALANYGANEVACDVELTVDGAVQAVRSATVPGRRPETPAEPGQPRPGQVSITFTLTQGSHGQPGAGGGAAALIGVRQLRRDALACDDAAWAVLPAPRRLAVMLVTAANPVLVGALRACPIAELKVVSPADFDGLLKSAGGSPLRFDMIVLDMAAPADPLPPGNYVIFGPPPRQLGLSAELRGELRNVVDWQGQHPVLQHVNLENLVVQKHWRVTGTPGGPPGPAGQPAAALQVLAKFTDGPAIAMVRRQGSVFLLVAFDVMESNWPFDAGLVMFCYNASGYIGSEMTSGEQTSLPVGGVITVRGQPRGQPGGGATAGLIVTGPAGDKTTITPLATGLPSVYRFAETRRVGIYTVAPPGGGQPGGPAAGEGISRFAVNLFDSEESNIAPAQQIVVSGQTFRAAQGEPVRANQELWPWLVLAALALVCLEWLAYNSRVRL